MDRQLTEQLLPNGWTVLAVEGRLNAVVAPQLKEHLKQTARAGNVNIVVDLAEVSFVDSSGLAALVSGFRAAREGGGTVRVAGLNEQTMTAFRLTRLDRVFEIHRDVESAIAGRNDGE
jgi:anti-sigma B factor antagonist